MARALEFRDVSYRIEGREILRNISFTVESGETLALLGRSGSGKTTTLRMVNALVHPTTGEVLVDGRPTSEWDVIQLRRRIGYVIQEVGLFPHWTVERNVALVPRLLQQSEQVISGRVENLLSRVGVPAADYGNADLENCPGASGNGLEWRERWQATLPSFYLTNPSAHSIQLHGWNFSGSLSRCGAISQRPRCLSHTTFVRR